MKIKVKYDDIVALLEAIDQYAGDYDPHDYGLPIHDLDTLDDLVKIVLEKLNLGLDEDPKIVAIMKHTGCSREQAVSLINSGELK